jgi:multidrug efflux system outer membrane protein
MARPLARGAGLLGFACVLLAGCAPTMPVVAPPALEMPAGWGPGERGLAGQWPDKEWWNRFGSAELARMVREGQASNLELGAALARVRQAEAQARIAGVALLPSVGLSNDVNRALPIGKGSASTSASTQLQVAYEVDFWGKNKASVAAAAASLEANRDDRQTVALTVTSGIVATYLQVLRRAVAARPA